MKTLTRKPDRVNPSVLFSHLQSDLQDHWSLERGTPGPDATPLQFASYQLLNSFYKKYVGAVSPDADSKALEKFLQVNDRCSNWQLDMRSSVDETLIGCLKQALYRFFYPQGMPLLTSFEQFLARGKVGPGASLGARGYDFYTKLFSSPLTCTSTFLYKIYRSYVWNFPEWSNAENIRVAEFGEARIVEGNRLSFVPKTSDISRTICVEPSLNMFFQLGLKDILEDRLVSAFGIDLTCQQAKNRELARLGSLCDDSTGFVTIDLSSASDSISLRMLREVLPSEVLAWFELLRSPKMILPDGRQVELGMVSTMGNGFTFPLQTILFSCVVIAASEVYNKPLKFPYGSSLGTFGVNGDDIICTKNVHRGVLRLLDLLGFQVNSDKTFIDGPFRESCGHDFYSGLMVRGVYVKDLSTPGSRYAVINALNLWTARIGIPLPATVRYLMSTVRHFYVPLWENQDSGIKVPWSVARKSLPRHLRYQAVLYSKVESRRSVIRITDHKVLVPRGRRSRIYNPSGLLIAILNGSVRSGTIGVRLDTNRYQTKRAIAPNWEWSPTSSDVASEERESFWEEACLANTGL